jgi:hypothetical protein
VIPPAALRQCPTVTDLAFERFRIEESMIPKAYEYSRIPAGKKAFTGMSMKRYEKRQ